MEVIEAYCHVVTTSELILSICVDYLRSRFSQYQLAAGHFGHVGLHQLHRKLHVEESIAAV